MKDKPNYKQALEELENIVASLEGEDLSVNDLSSKLSRASILIGICQQALHTTESEVKDFLESLKQGKTIEPQ